MDFQEYQLLFNEIIDGNIAETPYDDEHFVEYTRLNYSRQNRWLKVGEISEKTKSTVQSISTNQVWILITEPWCGDASHIVPFIAKMAELNSRIELKFQLRDQHSEIDKYLTNGGKSIPILVVRDENANDLFHWGPRPKDCQQLYYSLKNAKTSNEELKIALQKWYNNDKGLKIQEEICDGLTQVV